MIVHQLILTTTISTDIVSLCIRLNPHCVVVSPTPGWWQLGDVGGCFLLLVFLSGRRRSLFMFPRHCRPLRDLGALSVSSLVPLVSACLAFALSLITLTLASLLLVGLFNPGCSGVLAVCGSSAALLDVFSCPPR